MRDGDIQREGVIWPHVAEISLLGGLGCGSRLIELVLGELSKLDSLYEYVVIHATDNAIPFYERNRFVRVGAIARHEKKKKKNKSKKKKKEDELYTPPISTYHNEKKKKKRKRGRPRKYPPSSPPRHQFKVAHIEEKTVVRSRYSANVGVHVCEPDETPIDVAEIHNVDIRDVMWLNRDLASLKPKSKLYGGMCSYLSVSLSLSIV